MGTVGIKFENCEGIVAKNNSIHGFNEGIVASNSKSIFADNNDITIGKGCDKKPGSAAIAVVTGLTSTAMGHFLGING